MLSLATSCCSLDRLVTSIGGDGASALATCSSSAAYITPNLLFRCPPVRRNCWSVPLNTTDYFNRCVWVEQKVTVGTEMCIAPPSMANLNRSQVSTDVWSQCVSSTKTTTTVLVGQAQSNPVFDLLFT